MSDVRKQIEENRRNAAIQRMNETLVEGDQSSPKPAQKHGEMPIFGTSPKTVIQNLKGASEKP